MPDVTFVPNTPEWLADPYPSYRELREQDPVHWSEALGHWVLTRYDDVSFVLKDERFSAANRPPQRRMGRPTTMVTADPPEHTRLRKSVRHRFSLSAVNALRPRIQELADEFIDRAMPSDQIDIVTQIARPLPRTIMLELLGVPDPETVQKEATKGATLRPHNPHGGPRGIPLAPGTAMPGESYFEAAIEQHREELQDDVLGELLKAEAGREISPEEVLDTAVILYGAGQETTAKMIAGSLYHLLDNPEQLRKLRDNPDLMESAAEECLRFEGPAQAITRRAMEDIDVSGTRVQAGQKLLCVLSAANRDPEVFDEPDRLDITREVNPHIAFGTGIHACLGGNLARAEIQTMLSTLLARFPTMELVSDDVRWEGSFIIRGLASLPVRVR